MFSRDPGSIAERDPNPGNLEASPPAEISCNRSSVVCMCGSVRASTRLSCRGAAQACFEVVPDGRTHDEATVFADPTINEHFYAQNILFAYIGRLKQMQCKCPRWLVVVSDRS